MRSWVCGSVAAEVVLRVALPWISLLGTVTTACTPQSWSRPPEVGQDTGLIDAAMGTDGAAGVDSVSPMDGGTDSSIRDGSSDDRWGTEVRADGWDPGADGAWMPDRFIPPPGTQECTDWRECAPHYGDRNSGYECQGSLCNCDPEGTYLSTCLTGGGEWIVPECYCVFDAPPPPDPPSDENCWWSWMQGPCDPDRWVDTSYQIEQCYCCDAYGDDICDLIWIDDGYWESGACPEGTWELLCY